MSEPGRLPADVTPAYDAATRELSGAGDLMDSDAHAPIRDGRLDVLVSALGDGSVSHLTQCY